MKGKKIAAEEVIRDDSIGDVLAEPGTRSLVTHRTLIGPLADAYDEFQAAAASLESLQRAFQKAQERYRVALGRFSQLSAAALESSGAAVMTTAEAADAVAG